MECVEKTGGQRIVSPDPLHKECGLEDMGSYWRSLSHGGTKAKLALRRQMVSGSGMQSGPKGRDGATGESNTAVAMNGGRRRWQGLNQDNGGSSTGANSRILLLSGCEMSVSVSHHTSTQIRNEFQGGLTGYIVSHPAWHLGSLRHCLLKKVRCAWKWKWRLLQLCTAGCWRHHSNPSHPKHESLPGTCNCSPVCYTALSIPTPESQPSLGLPLMELSTTIPISLEGEKQELRDGQWGWKWVMAQEHNLSALFRVLPIVQNPISGPSFA